MTGLYLPPLRRWNGRWFDPPQRAAWEMVLADSGTGFYLTLPAPWAPVAQKQVAVVWPGATVQAASDPLAGTRPSRLTRLELKHHYMFGLKADRRTLGVLPALLETSRLLGPGERVVVQVLLDPAPPDWWHGAATAYEEFRRGRMPHRLDLDSKTLGQFALRGLTYAVLEACGIVQELLSGQPPEPIDLEGPSKALALREVPVGASVANKLRQDAFDVTIRLAVQTASPAAAEALMRSATQAFRCLDGDNALVVRPEPPAAWQRVLAREPGFKLNSDYLSLRELSMITMLPTGPLQEQYRLEAVDHRETNLPALVTSGGLRLGTATYKGRTMPIYLPTRDADELCLPHVVIGGMGCGKTRGFAANLAREAVRAGLGAVVIDPARGEVGDELEAVLKPEQLVRVRFGRRPVALDWREVRHCERARNRLANELIAFCEAASEEAGAQTVRYLRAAAKAVPAGRLSEVVRLLTEPAYLESLLPAMRPAEQATWEQFRGLTDARRAQIALPVLNRLDIIMGDDYLAACMDAHEGLDLVQLLEQPRAVVLDIPAGELGREAVDVLAALCATKIDLAMVLRRSRHPVFIIQDEPHQYLRSTRTWRAAAVESRKWRFGYVWLFHSWAQLPRGLAEIIKAAGPHYHLYSSSKETFRALAEEIAPWTVEEALRIPRYHALQVLRAGGQTVPPFLVRMDPPPSVRRREGS